FTTFDILVRYLRSKGLQVVYQDNPPDCPAMGSRWIRADRVSCSCIAVSRVLNFPRVRGVGKPLRYTTAERRRTRMTKVQKTYTVDGKRRPMGKRQSIRSVITTASMDPVSAEVASTSGIKLLQTPYHAPRANAICERFLRSVRQECLDHVLILHKKQLQRVLNGYVAYFNQARPHQGIAQQIPEPSRSALSSHHAGNKVIAIPVMGGLHHDYHWAA